MRTVLTAVLTALALAGCGGQTSPSAGEPQTGATGSATPSVEARPEEGTTEPDESTKAEGATETTEPTPTATSIKKRVRGYDVLDVVDGDTVKVRYRSRSESIRIIGIDTPETVHPFVPDECWGPAASSAATRVLSGERVRLIFDPSQGRRDAYQRLLAYVAIPGRGDFGQIMIRRGHAIEYTYDTAYARQGAYRVAEYRARTADRGLWGECGGADVPLEQPESEPTPEPEPDADPGAGCAAGYDPCVPLYPPDVDCADVDGPITVTGDDPHVLDADGDGIACES